MLENQAKKAKTMSNDELDQSAREAFSVALELRSAAEYVDKPNYPIKPLSPQDLGNWSERVYRIGMTLAALQAPPSLKAK